MSYTCRKGLICDFPNCNSRASGGWIRRLYDRLRGISPERLTEEADRESARWLGWTETNHGHKHYCRDHGVREEEMT